MKTLEIFKKQKQDIARFEKSLERMRKAREEVKTAYYGGIDKHDDGFSKDPNTSGIKVKAARFHSVTGYFGSSDVYSDFENSSFVEDCLLKAMDALKDEILDKTLEIMQKNTEALKDEALKEYTFMQDELNQ